MTQHILKHTKTELEQHLFDYLLLISAGVFFLIAINALSGQRLLEFLILFAFVSFYIIWGVYHHIIKGDLHLKIVLEYILIGFTLMFLLKILILP